MNSSERIRIEFLDGIRGLAALYVMIGHAYVAIRGQVDPFIGGAELKLLKLIDAGHFAVAIFIVLSGYVLMLPIARSAGFELRGGWREYIKRRARRIMPPYFAALVLSLALILLFPAIARPGDLTWQAILSHALLVHNLHPDTMLAINGPMWSVAFEWQIYFFLPFLLLPALRRFGPFAMLAAGFAAGLLPFFLLPEGYNLAWTFPWYIGLFALGNLGALINFSAHPRLVALRARLPWGLITLGLFAATGAMLLFRLSWAWQHLWFADSLIGLTAVIGIITLTNALAAQQQSPGRAKLPLLIVRALEWRWIGLLGAFSYSLYLIHEPIIAVMTLYIRQLPLQGLPLLAAQFAIVTPVILALSYLFYLACERPFMNKPKAAAAPKQPEVSVAAD
jgi:peptidoglycan/LPS O-acetylase OafA/YrhL